MKQTLNITFDKSFTKPINYKTATEHLNTFKNTYTIGDIVRALEEQHDFNICFTNLITHRIEVYGDFYGNDYNITLYNESYAGKITKVNAWFDDNLRYSISLTKVTTFIEEK